MNFRKKLCYWIWDLFLFQKHWMVWLFPMVVWNYFSKFWFFYIQFLSSRWGWTSYCSVWVQSASLFLLWNVRLKFSSDIISISDLIIHGWWGKSAMFRLCFLIFCSAYVLSHAGDGSVLSVSIWICKWCLLIQWITKTGIFCSEKSINND